MATMGRLCVAGPCLLLIAMQDIPSAQAHVVDVCVAPPGNTPDSGVYNFFSGAADLGCDYRNMSAECVAAVLEDSDETFAEYSICRGVIHFNAVYFTAAALGFTQDIAHMFAAFSQAIDYTQYAAIDSCGRNMSESWWTPPLRGLKRTTTAFGGTNRHLGVPFAGWLEDDPVLKTTEKSGEIVGRPITQRNKTYTGGSKHGCKDLDMSKSFATYAKMCPALVPDYNDYFYEGALASGRDWAFGKTNLLCNGVSVCVRMCVGPLSRALLSCASVVRAQVRTWRGAAPHISARAGALHLDATEQNM